MAKNIAGVLTDDSRILHMAGFEYDWVAEAVDADCRDGVMTVALKLDSGRRMKMSAEAVGDGIFRLRAWKGRVRFQQTSPMIAATDLGPKKAKFRKGKNAFVFTCGDHSIRVDRAPFAVCLLDGKGTVLWQLESEDRAAGGLVTPPLGYRTSEAGEHPFLSWRIRNDERLLGWARSSTRSRRPARAPRSGPPTPAA